MVVIWCAVVWCGMMACGWFRGDVRTGNVVGREMSCYVMLSHVRSYDVMWCDVVVWCVGLRDAVLWTTESPCHSETRETSIPMRGATLGCKTQGKYGEPMSQKCGSVRQRTPRCYKVLPPTTDPCDSCNTWNVMYIAPSNLRDANTMELPHSCLIVATHETSCTLRRVTYGMQTQWNYHIHVW